MAGFRPPYVSSAAQSLVTIAFLIAASSDAASCRAIVTDSGGVAAQPNSVNRSETTSACADVNAAK